MTIGLVAWTVSALFNAAATCWIYRSLRPVRWVLRPVAWLFLFVFVTTSVQMTMGLLGILRPLHIGLVSLLGLVLLLLPASSRLAMRETAQEARELAGGLAEAWHSLPGWLKWLSAILLLGLTSRFAFLIWALPPFVWDSLTYHLPNVAAWTQAGRIFVVESPVARMLSPANFEVFATWFTVFLHHDLVVEAAGLPAYALGVGSVFALGRVMGLAKWSSWLAALGFATTPALLLAATGTKNDPIMVGLFLLIVALGWDMASDRGAGRGQPRLAEGVLILLALALGFGTKAYILQLLAGGLVIAFLVWRTGAPRRGLRQSWVCIRDAWRGWSRGKRGLVVGVLAVGLFLGGFWYVRNWIITGNPFYPYGVQVGETMVLQASGDAARVTWRDFVTNLTSVADRLGDKPRRISADLPQTTGWGWVAYGLGLPALAWGLARSSRQRILFAGFVVALLLVVQASPTALWLTRFLAWVPALLCLSIGEVVEALGPASRMVRWGFGALVAVACSLNVVATLNYGMVSPDDFEIMLSKPALQREAAELPVTVPAEYADALALVPEDAVLGYNVHGNGFIYPLYRAAYSQHLVYIPILPGATCAEIADTMEAHGTRYLFVAPEHTDDWTLGLLYGCANQGDVLRERVRGLYVVKRG